MNVGKGLLSAYCIRYGVTELRESMIFINGEERKLVPISFAFYLIHTEDKKILIDVGCDSMPGFCMKKFCLPVVALQRLGVSSDEITDVVITHAHRDHIQSIKHFKNAVVHITEDEYAAGKSYIPDGMKVHAFKENYVIHPQITVLKWGGHTVGSAIVEIAQGDVVHVFTGDECYTDECITRKIPTGAYQNVEKSREFIEKYSNQKYRVHTCHDRSLQTERIL